MISSKHATLGFPRAQASATADSAKTEYLLLERCLLNQLEYLYLLIIDELLLLLHDDIPLEVILSIHTTPIARAISRYFSPVVSTLNSITAGNKIALAIPCDVS